MAVEKKKGERRFIMGWLVKVGGGILVSNGTYIVIVCYINDI